MKLFRKSGKDFKPRHGDTLVAGPPDVRIKETRLDGDGVELMLTLSPEFKNELCGFLEQKGYMAYGQETKGIAQLLRYGLSVRNRDELERNKRELDLSRYAGMRFELYQLSQGNSARTMVLSGSLEENRRLKGELRDRGLSEADTKDEWDSWDKRTVDEFFKKYVFSREQPPEQTGVKLL